MHTYPDLTTKYLGLTLRSPLVASPGPYTGDLDRLSELQDAGAGAVVLPSLFEEQIEHETAEIDRLFSVHHDSSGEASSFLPEVDGYNTGPDAYLTLVEAARDRLDIPIIASLNGTNIGGWIRYARLIEDAGADALELNLYAVAADPSRSGASLEAEQLELVALLTGEVKLPVAVKVSPYYSSLAAFLLGLQDAGAAGVVMFNRFYAPDLDPETLDVTPRIALSNHTELRVPLRWIGIAHDFLKISIAGSTGVHGGIDAAKLILVGADVAMTTSCLLFHGPGYLSTIEFELREWMQHHGYHTVDEMRGAVSREAAADPSAYERANYIGNLTNFTSRFLGGSSPSRRIRSR
jgi:dihydroorotate dehydrogenase (fumarate)